LFGFSRTFYSECKSEDEAYAQPRPNVIFELGRFYGRLCRGKVCILFRKGTKIHSDLDGISRIEFGDSILEKEGEIKKELLAANILTK
jgi:predicted nucleotide-binding protein